MRVLGIDPGSRITGLGVVESSDKGLRAIYFHNLHLQKAELPVRLGSIYRFVAELVQKYRPDYVAVEQVFVANNPKSALTLGHARGSAICAAVTNGYDISEYSALQVKRAVVGNGNATKDQVEHMVRALLGLREKPGSDAADALACAICHIHTVEVEERMQRAAMAR